MQITLWMKRKYLLCIPAVAVWSLLVSFAESPQADYLKQHIALFKMTSSAEGIAGALMSEYKIPIGMESITDPAGAHGPNTVTVSIENGTAEDVLNAMVRADQRYYWEVRDGVVNIIPKNGRSPILETVVHTFAVQDMSTYAASVALTKTPEVALTIKRLGLQRQDIWSLPGPTELTMPRVSLKVQDMAVRQILNRMLTTAHASHWHFAISRLGDTESFTLKIY